MHELRGILLLQPEGQLPLGVQHIMCHHPSSIPPSPGPQDPIIVQGRGWEPGTLQKSQEEEGRLQGEKPEKERTWGVYEPREEVVGGAGGGQGCGTCEESPTRRLKLYLIFCRQSTYWAWVGPAGEGEGGEL